MNRRKKRQMNALEWLKLQLKGGMKTEKKSYDKMIPLTEKDRDRINKEIEILESKA